MRTRLTLLSIFLIGALLAAGAASGRTAGLVVDKGIVQSVSASQVVLRGLDGRTITITVGPKTRVFLNDSPAPLSAIQPGYVAGALHDGGRPAVYVRAVGRASLAVDKGVIVSVSSGSLVLRTAAGPVTITVGPSTAVMLNGQPATLADLRPGYAAEVTHRGSDPAVQIRALGRKR
ncbi:MAG: hypothetical protein ACXVZN_02165 [Gaiellaceae bacterium]